MAKYTFRAFYLGIIMCLVAQITYCRGFDYGYDHGYAEAMADVFGHITTPDEFFKQEWIKNLWYANRARRSPQSELISKECNACLMVYTKCRIDILNDKPFHKPLSECEAQVRKCAKKNKCEEK